MSIRDPENGIVDISHHFDGTYRSSKGINYRNPTKDALSEPNPDFRSKTKTHRDFLGRITQIPKDLPQYISPTYAKVFHLIVQATPQAYEGQQGEWRRGKLQGDANTLVRVAVWAVGDLNDPLPTDGTEQALLALRVFLILPAMIFLMPIPHGRGRRSDKYPVFFGRSWDYPKYPRNTLDGRPGDSKGRNVNGRRNDREEVAAFNVSGERDLLLKPRRLMVKQPNNRWELVETGHDHHEPRVNTEAEPYIVISYTSRQFQVDQTANTNRQLERLAEDMAAREGVKAYWIDYKCTARQQPELSEGVHRICDVFRGACQFYAAVPDLSLASKQFWGSRMWCLPEALLCSRPEIVFCSPHGGTEEYTKIQLAAHVWNDGMVSTRLLAEHYTGLLTLSRLELISVGLEALTGRYDPDSAWTKGDVAYALMSLLRYRPRMDPEASSFQALARLSLANDSDRIVERAVCLLPDPSRPHHTAFVLEDQLGAKLWDIEPLCQVTGVGDDNSVFLDGCQAASVRWKNVPRIYFHGRNTWKKRWANRGWRTAPLWFVIGLALVIHAGEAKDPITGKTMDPAAAVIGTIFFVIGLAMLLYGPWGVQRMHSGKVWGSTPWLIGFEGLLGIKQVERIFFGNAIGRISYAPSSGIYCDRDPSERIGLPPTRIPDPETLRTGYRWFTLVDTGPSMHVHIFQAKRPPSVALICGKEGGMLRVVLCSYEAQGNMLRKESVLRMETPMLSLTSLHSWLRLSLDSVLTTSLN